MNAAKQVQQKQSSIQHWIVSVAVIVFYVICYAMIIITGIRNSAPVTDNENIDILQIIWDSLGNVGTLIPLLVAIVSALFLKWKHKRLSNKNIILISSIGFVLYCFYTIQVKHHVHPALVAFIGLITFVVSIIIVLLQPSNIVIKQGSIIQSAIGNKIKNAKIAGIQIFECSMTEDIDNINYCIHSIDHLSNNDSDINGILSTTYRLKKTDINDFDFVTKTSYQALIDSANDSAKDDLIKLIETKRNGIKTRLQRITLPSDVTKDDCCLARIMIMYNAYLSALSPAANGTTVSPNTYIGEHDFRDGDLGVDGEVEKRLFNFVRTGLLGGILVGSECIYQFQYRKDGYKTGRQYCVFHINEKDSADQDHLFLCLVVIKDVSTKAMPAYILEAIRKMTPSIEAALRKSIQEVNI